MSFNSILVVEDEALIAESIVLFLNNAGYENVVYEICFEDVAERISQDDFDFVILDIKLFGKKSGIDVAKELLIPNSLPFIYLTSQNDERLRDAAITTIPLGYVNKPFRKESLLSAVKTAEKLYQSYIETDRIVFIPSGNKTYKILSSRIKYIEADHIYSNIIFEDGKSILIRKPLGEILESLNKEQFFRIHRSFIVNLEHITSINGNKVCLEDIELPLSRAKREEIQEFIEK